MVRFPFDLQRVTDAPCGEHKSVDASERSTRHPIETAIVRVEKNELWFHRAWMPALNCPFPWGKPSDCSVSGDRLPVTLS